MTPQAAALEYIRLATLALGTASTSSEWMDAIDFACAFEDGATPEAISEYYAVIDQA